MFQAFNEINKHLAKLTSFERAMFKNLPKSEHRYFRNSDLISDTDFMESIGERVLTTGQHEIDRAIQLDRADESLRLFLQMYIQYTGPSMPIKDIHNMYVYIMINYALAHKANDTVRALINHEFVRRCLIKMLSTRAYISPNGMEKIFKHIDASSQLFKELFIEDSFIMDCVKSVPSNVPLLIESLVISTIESRHYDGIEVLRSIDPDTVNHTLAHITDSIRAKPEQRFVNACLCGYRLCGFMKRIDQMTVDLDIEICGSQIHPLNESIDEETRIYLENACTYGIMDEALALLANSGSFAKPICEYMQWRMPFGVRDMVIDIRQLLSITIDELITIIENDRPRELLDAISDNISDGTIFMVLSIVLNYKAHKCLSALLIHADIGPIISHLTTQPIDVYYSNHSSFYGAIAELGDDYMEPFEEFNLLGLMSAAADTALFAGLYTANDRIKTIPMDQFDDFRYAMVIGSIVHMNLDTYTWLIDELYGDEDEFISDFYLRQSRLCDEYYSGEHRMINVFKAFKLYQKTQDAIIERDL